MNPSQIGDILYIRFP